MGDYLQKHRELASRYTTEETDSPLPAALTVEDDERLMDPICGGML